MSQAHGGNIFCSLIGKPTTPNADIRDLFKTPNPLGLVVFKSKHVQESLGELVPGQEYRCRCKEETCEHDGGEWGGWDYWEIRFDINTLPCVK